MGYYDKILLNGDVDSLSFNEKRLIFDAAIADIQNEKRYSLKLLFKYLKGLKTMLVFYENEEEYEKCLILKNLINELQGTNIENK